MHDQEASQEPAHHARRPMNAFLIFCKRHRSVVKDKYQNLENRTITKILGEWWANLDKEDKTCYTSLAKQYKDAFFNANPDFKWYKLPAPPLRTLSSRPRDSDKPTTSPTNEHHDHEEEKTNNNSTKVDFNKKTHNDYFEDPKPLSMFTPGKLADEAQMGGLSSLLATKTETTTTNPFYSPFKINPISNEYRSHSLIDRTKNRDDIRELQNALTETSKVFEEDFEDKQGMYATYGVPNEVYTHQDMIDQIVDKRYLNEDYGYKNSSDEEKNVRSDRSCKGKRYQEFMAVGGLIVNKRQKRNSRDKPDDVYSETCGWETGNIETYTPMNDEPKQGCSIEKSADIEIDTVDGPEPDSNINKSFRAIDFDLDAKIRALPSLSLEKHLQRKRDNKRRKKTINLKPKVSPTIVNSVPRPYMDDRRELESREGITGSQKRKPRKISITRFEINSLSSVAETNVNTSPEIKIATEAPATVVHDMELCKQPQHVDLLALATLAEVASNTSKLDSSVIEDASAPTDRASLV